MAATPQFDVIIRRTSRRDAPLAVTPAHTLQPEWQTRARTRSLVCVLCVWFLCVTSLNKATGVKKKEKFPLFLAPFFPVHVCYCVSVCTSRKKAAERAPKGPPREPHQVTSETASTWWTRAKRCPKRTQSNCETNTSGKCFFFVSKEREYVLNDPMTSYLHSPQPETKVSLLGVLRTESSRHSHHQQLLRGSTCLALLSIPIVAR